MTASRSLNASARCRSAWLSTVPLCTPPGSPRLYRGGRPDEGDTYWDPMISIHLRYEIDPDKLDEFTHYGREWIRLVTKLGGTHHGYFMPSEGDSDEAFALFTFPSLAEYEAYRTASLSDPECL